MSSLNQDNYRVIDPVLTTLAQDYENGNMIAGALFPVVKVNHSKGKIPKFNKNSFISRITDRAPGAKSNRIDDLGYELIPFELTENDVEIAIDYLENEGSDNFMKLEQKAMKDLTNILALGREIVAAKYAQTPANYGPACSTNAATTGFLNPSANPIKLIKNAAEQMRARLGVKPNTAAIGAAAYNAMLEHPDVLDRVKFAGLRNISTNTLAELLEINTIRVGYAQTQTNNGTFKDVWTDTVILAYVDENEPGRRSQYSPSFGYTLQRNGCPEVDSYYENGGKLKVIRATDNYTLKVTCPEAAHLIYNCLASTN